MTAKRESALRSRIALRLRARGWLVVVQHGGAYSQVGVSDVIGCAAGRFFALEVKTAVGATTPAQEAFLRRVFESGGIAGVAHTPQEAEDIVLAGLETEIMPEILEDLGLDDLDLDSIDIDMSESAPPPHVGDALWADAPVVRDAIIKRAVADASDDLFGEVLPSGLLDDEPMIRVGDVAGTDPLGALCARLDVLLPGVVESIELLSRIVDDLHKLTTTPWAGVQAQAAPSRKRAPKPSAPVQAQPQPPLIAAEMGQSGLL